MYMGQLHGLGHTGDHIISGSNVRRTQSEEVHIPFPQKGITSQNVFKFANEHSPPFLGIRLT